MSSEVRDRWRRFSLSVRMMRGKRLRRGDGGRCGVGRVITTVGLWIWIDLGLYDLILYR